MTSLLEAVPPARAPHPLGGRYGTILIVLAAMIVFAKLGATHLVAFDDCYYAQKAKEMVRSGDWFTPHFAGHPRWDNPPLFLWLIAAAFSALGVSNWAAIFWSALSGVLAVGLTYRLALTRLGVGAFGAFASAVVLLTTQYFLKYARHAMFDVFLSFLFLAAIWGYVGAMRGDRRQFLILGAATGLGVMTKSVLGLFPLAVATLHMIGTGRGRRLFDPWFLASLLVFAAIGLPWYLLQYAANGDRFVNEHFRWLLVGQVVGPQGGERSWTSYLDYARGIATVYWPWLPLALGGLVLAARRAFAGAAAPAESWSQRDTARLLNLWLFLVVGVMSLAGEKKLWYVMSAFPCLALLSGIAAEAWIRSEGMRARLRDGSIVVLALAGIAMCLGPGAFSKDRRPDLQAIALATRETVPPGVTLLNLDARYWKLANQFLFYSDHDVTEPLGDPERVRSGLLAGGFALLTDRGYERVAAGDSTTYRVLASSGSWRLVAGPGHHPVILSAGRGD